MLVGALAAGAAGVAVAAKVGWKRVSGVFSRRTADAEAGSLGEGSATTDPPGSSDEPSDDG